MTHVTVRNGLTLAYTIGLLNASLALLIAFGVTLSNTQQATIVAFVNAAILLAARVLHMPERTPTGTVQVEHVPVLTTTTKGEPVTVTPLPLETVTPQPPDAPPIPAG